MILWAKAAAVRMPVDQRVEFVELVADNNIRVKLCGTGNTTILEPNDLCGVEIGDHPLDKMSLKFSVHGTRRTKAVVKSA